MKLSVFLLVALLALSSAAQQEQNPTTEDEIPELKVKRSLTAPPAHMRHRICRSSVFHGSALEWQTADGSVPRGTVQVYSSDDIRHEYVCKYGCHSGSYNPSLGNHCYYSYANKEHRGSPFEILVNKDYIERLEWRSGSWGGVPANSVKTCAGEDIYVGKNWRGLGKVSVRREALFVPWNGQEYWFKEYEVLTINKDFGVERMYNFVYDTSNTKITEHPPESFCQSSVTNNACGSVQKTAQLSRTFEGEKRWDSSSSFTVGISTAITVGIPEVGSAGVTISPEATFILSSGYAVTKLTNYSLPFKLTVPPNHSCRASMVGRRYEAEIPFTATLVRRYNEDGATTTTVISGTFTCTNVGGIHSVEEGCEPLPKADPCPLKAS